MAELGRIEIVDLRSVWANEAKDFTPWLAENLSLLGDEMGLTLEHRATEAPTEFGWLDILAYDRTRDCLCAIENQLEPSDNDHLARVLQYAASFDARTVIWVAASFRDEHLDTINWLNWHTGHEIKLHAVEIHAIKIGDSQPAPLFRPVALLAARPASQGSESSSPGERNNRNIQFFQPLLEGLKEEGWKKSRNTKDNFMQLLESDFSGIEWGISLEDNNKAGVMVWITKGEYDSKRTMYDPLEAQKAYIEKDLGDPDDSKISGMYWYRRGDDPYAWLGLIRDEWSQRGEEAHDEIRSWMKKYLLKFKEVFTPRLKAIVATEGADLDGE